MADFSFRTASFGGYNRDDVRDYIDKMNSSHAAEVTSLSDQLSAACEQVKRLDEINADWRQRMATVQSALQQKESDDAETLKALQAENCELKEQIEQLSELDLLGVGEEKQKLREQLEDLKRVCEEQKQSISRAAAEAKDYNSTVESQSAQIQKLESELSQYQKDADSYRAMCGSIGVIELDMRERLQQMQQQTEEENAKQVANTQAECAALIENAQKESSDILSDAANRLLGMKESAKKTAEMYRESIRATADELLKMDELMNRLRNRVDSEFSAIQNLTVQQQAPVAEDPAVEAPVEVAADQTQEAASAAEAPAKPAPRRTTRKK